MVKVKICGITNLEDALASFFAGADALGFVFYKKSPRYIDPSQASNISRILPKKIKRVGVFVNAGIPAVKRIARLCALDMLQFHGQESGAYCRKFKNYKVIKALSGLKPNRLSSIFWRSSLVVELPCGTLKLTKTCDNDQLKLSASNLT